MQKTLDIISVLLKLLITAFGGVAAADLTAVHIDGPLLGTIISGLGTASIIVKAIQTSQKPEA